MIETRDEYVEWCKIAKNNNVKELEKFLGVEFPNIIIFWKRGVAASAAVRLGETGCAVEIAHEQIHRALLRCDNFYSNEISSVPVIAVISEKAKSFLPRSLSDAPI